MDAGKVSHSTFGQMVKAGRLAKKWSTARLGGELFQHDGDLVLGDTQIRRIEHDERAKLAPNLVAALIAVLELDPVDAVRVAYPEVGQVVIAVRNAMPEVASQPGKSDFFGIFA